MPEESIASYINNIASFTMMILASGFIFLVLFFIWRTVAYRVKRKYPRRDEIKIRAHSQFKGRLSEFSIKPYLIRNIFTLASVFIFVALFLLLAFAVFDYSGSFRTGFNLFIIIGIVFYLVLILIYLVRSKILD